MDVNNFKICRSLDTNNIFKLEGINKSIDQIVNHLTDSKQLLISSNLLKYKTSLLTPDIWKSN